MNLVSKSFPLLFVPCRYCCSFCLPDASYDMLCCAHVGCLRVLRQEEFISKMVFRAKIQRRTVVEGHLPCPFLRALLLSSARCLCVYVVFFSSAYFFPPPTLIVALFAHITTTYSQFFSVLELEVISFSPFPNFSSYMYILL